MSKKTDGPDVRLLAWFETSNGFGLTRYAHLQVRAVVLAPDKYASDGRWDAHDPGSYSIDVPAAVRALASLGVRALVGVLVRLLPGALVRLLPGLLVRLLLLAGRLAGFFACNRFRHRASLRSI